MLLKFHTVIRALIASKKVTIAAVHGHCLGGGAELAMVCDIVYTSVSAQWGFPEIKLGCFPPVACAALAALVGQKRAAELILTGRTISGSEAAQIGLATRAVPEENSHNAVEMHVRELLNSVRRLGGHKESVLCVGRHALRQGSGASREDLSGRIDEDCRCTGRHPRFHGKARTEVDGEVAGTTKPMDYEITPEEVKTKLDQGEEFTLLDVREPWEFETAHMAGAKLVPMGDIPRARIRNSILKITLWWSAITACAR